RAEIEGAGLTVTIDVPATPVTVLGDRTRLSQVLANVVLNATKFTPAGGRIDVRLGVSDERALLEIVDTGIGITPHALDELFEPFVQAHAREEDSRGGLGLGLALVKGLVELHGGEVEARSDGAGRGSTFTVRLPVITAVEVAPTEEVAGGGEPLSVLVV